MTRKLSSVTFVIWLSRLNQMSDLSKLRLNYFCRALYKRGARSLEAHSHIGEENSNKKNILYKDVKEIENSIGKKYVKNIVKNKK